VEAIEIVNANGEKITARAAFARVESGRLPERGVI
jgi:hypothetical protein